MDVIRFGRSIRALRRRRGWRQVDLASAARTSKSVVGRLEIGSEGVSVRVLERVARALDARLEVRLLWNGEALDRLLDEAHAAAVDATVGLFTRNGWEAAVEVSFAIGGERGSIDVLAFHAPTRTLAVVEVKSVIADAGSTVHVLDRKTRLGREIAASRSWGAASVGRVLVVIDSRTARRRVDVHGLLFGAAFPARGREVTAWIRDPAPTTAPGPTTSLHRGGSAPFSGLYFLPPSQEERHRARGGRQRVRVAKPRERG